MIYVTADIHGHYEKYRAMLEKIDFHPEDTLYILGDVIDRGPEGVRILRDMMLRPNVLPILGNHEFMAAMCLPWLLEEITEESLARLDEAHMGALQDWMNNGGGPTLRALGKLSQEERGDILDYLREFALYEEVEVDGRSFVLVHAGLDNFAPEKPLEEYQPEDFLFSRPTADTAYWSDKIVIFGHTPTRYLGDKADGIVSADSWMDIDCGCGFGGTLGCLCLHTMEKFYV